MLGVFAEFETNLRRERSLRAGVLVSIGCSIAFEAASSPVSASYITAPGLTPARTLRSRTRGPYPQEFGIETWQVSALVAALIEAVPRDASGVEQLDQLVRSRGRRA